jgi:[ribosomal protein S18]-alanine N-acetyltransferase
MTADGVDNFKVRLMRMADVDRVMDIAASLRDAPHWARASYVEALGSTGLRRLALIAEEVRTNEIAAFGIVRLTPPESELETIVTAAPFQRRGIALQIFAGLAAALRAEGVTEVTLEVRQSNQPAQAFYDVLGFAECGRRKSYYADPVEDAVLMRRVLA